MPTLSFMRIEVISVDVDSRANHILDCSRRPCLTHDSVVSMLTPQGWITLAAILGVFFIMQFRRGVPTDLLFLGALVLVTLTGVITPQEALSGFSSNAIATIAGLLVCAAGLRSTGVLDWIGRALLGSVVTERAALSRLAITLVATSSFVLNTALVAMTMPVVLDWCRKRNVSPSRLLIPISYLTILGGVCTLVGTSTTLVVNQQLEAEYQQRSIRLTADAGALRRKS